MSESLEPFVTYSINRAAYLLTRGHHVEAVPSGSSRQAVFMIPESAKLFQDLEAYDADQDGAKTLLNTRARLVQEARTVTGWKGGRYD